MSSRTTVPKWPENHPPRGASDFRLLRRQTGHCRADRGHEQLFLWKICRRRCSTSETCASIISTSTAMKSATSSRRNPYESPISRTGYSSAVTAGNHEPEVRQFNISRHQQQAPFRNHDPKVKHLIGVLKNGTAIRQRRTYAQYRQRSITARPARSHSSKCHPTTDFATLSAGRITGNQ